MLSVNKCRTIENVCMIKQSDEIKNTSQIKVDSEHKDILITIVKKYCV